VTSVSVYTDDCCGCSDPGAPALLTLSAASTRSSCGDVPSGAALGSKEATPPVYQPGQCAPSGQPDHNDPIGAVTGDDSEPDSGYTLCCHRTKSLDNVPLKGLDMHTFIRAASLAAMWLFVFACSEGTSTSTIGAGASTGSTGGGGGGTNCRDCSLPEVQWK
jgi:hypothetical protein